MQDYIAKNKKAWEFDAYDFWVKHAGKPAELAESMKVDPEKKLKHYARFYNGYAKQRIANICGSCGKKAIPLALLGANVTIFDISEQNKRYACEVAESAGVTIQYEVGDVLEINRSRYENAFDVVFMEGGILHYFHDMDVFMKVMYFITKPNGTLICSDFHPFTKIIDTLNLQQKTMSYFSTEIFEGEMAHARFYPDEIRNQIPKCTYRKYTMSEIINSVLEQGFQLKRFEEHPAWENETVPGEFTILAKK